MSLPLEDSRRPLGDQLLRLTAGSRHRVLITTSLLIGVRVVPLHFLLIISGRF